MNKIKLLLLTIVVTSISYGQDDMDDIFDDGDKDSKFKIGTEIMTFAGGTPNVYLDFTPIEKVSIKVGGGLMLFKKHIDVMLFREHEIVINDISSGKYFDLSLKLNTTYAGDTDFSYYYYGGFRRWSYNYLEDIAVKRSKISGGVGYNIGLAGRFNLDLRFGAQLIMGKANSGIDFDQTHNEAVYFANYGFDGNNQSQSSFNASFDFGIGLNYAL